MSNDVWIMVAVAALIGAAAFFAMAETALTRINHIKALTLEEQGKRGATKLRRLVEKPEEFLNPILLFVLMCHLVAATLVGIFAERRFSAAAAFIVSTAIEIIVVFVFAEAAPKTWAIQHSERAALFTAPFVYFLTRLLPVRLLTRGLIGMSNVLLPGKGLEKGPFVSEQELLASVDAAADADEIESEERALIHSIIEFGDTVVREVMVPRPDMVAVEGKDRISDVMEVAMTAGYSRIPVFELNVDDITGIVFAKDLMKARHEGKQNNEVRTLVREAHFVPETKHVSELLREMQKGSFHMALVIDEYGGTAGVVTLEDLIEELVGEIVDEFDVEEPLMEPMPNGDVRVNARMPIDEVNELLGIEIPDGDWDTVGGFLFDLLGHVPHPGESVNYGGHRLVAEKVQGRRIGRVRIVNLATAEASAETDVS